MKKPLIALGLLVVLALGAWAWMHQRDKGPDGALVLYGNVDIRQVALAFDGSGRVADMQVDEGDAVQAGQVLATLDTQTLTLQTEQAQAQIGVQQQNLLRLKNGSRPEELAQARSGYAAAQADAERARKDLARLQGIAAQTEHRGVSAQELDRAQAAAQVADAQAAQKRDALRLTEIGPRKEDIAAAEAQLKASEAQLALLQHQVSQGQLVSPSDAVVRSRLLEPGDMATPQKPAYALAITEPKWVRVYVGEPDLGKVKPGQAARVTTDSAPGQSIAGKVGYISSVAEFTPKSVQTEELRTSLVYEVRVIVEDKDNALRLGQPATVVLSNGDAP
ncbi:HlyD family efflux transporter periplasmic adaptor subunit [Acidovorax sp. HDW3]|uniref:HlyD family efflux transporter periplasmic adaptor subunit n=1 Tax=Acidovorax sp. HDW3 TaxID=2714923 RepID=UPI00140AF104|nr:HlyD family efflux transporter periplasmic adaptor subunit [Acidovorax sp. HDW3]QIL43480.1 HlyD family efflux transporter periplasmic adaptor subunit [Acidovorax sp. HDW3]